MCAISRTSKLGSESRDMHAYALSAAGLGRKRRMRIASLGTSGRFFLSSPPFFFFSFFYTTESSIKTRASKDNACIFFFCPLRACKVQEKKSNEIPTHSVRLRMSVRETKARDRRSRSGLLSADAEKMLANSEASSSRETCARVTIGRLYLLRWACPCHAIS